MASKRKTIDVYTLQGNYGHGWEDVTAELTRFDIRERKKEYEQNEGGNYRIVNKREPRTAENEQQVTEAQAAANKAIQEKRAARLAKQAQANNN